MSIVKHNSGNCDKNWRVILQWILGKNRFCDKNWIGLLQESFKLRFDVFSLRAVNNFCA
jgi:hypothetical protein